MKIILMSLLIISLNSFAGDGEGTGGKSTSTEVPKKPEAQLFCVKTNNPTKKAQEKVCYFVFLKGDGEGTGGK